MPKKKQPAIISTIRTTPNKNLLHEKGKVSVQLSGTLMAQGVAAHPTEFEDLELMYRQIPIIYGAVNKTVDFTVGPSFTIKDLNNNENTENLLNDFIREMNFDILLRTITRDMLVFGNAFVEHITDASGIIIRLQVLDPKTMFVVRNEFGEVEGFRQIITVRARTEVISFIPQQISHFKFNVIGSEAYGMGVIQPVIVNAMQRDQLEKSVSMLSKRKGNPTLVLFGGDSNNRLTQEQLNQAADKLSDLRENQEFVLPHDARLEILDYGGKSVLDFKTYLSYFQEQMVFAMEVPAVLLGVANVPEGLAKAQSKAFQRRIVSIQQAIETVLEDEIFQRFLEAQGLRGDIEFEWDEPSDEDKRAELAVLTQLLNNFLLDGELRKRIQERVNQLLGFPPLPKNRNEEELQPAPLVPPFAGSRGGPARPPVDEQPETAEEKLRETELTEEEELMELKEDLNRDMTIKEFLGFSYTELLSFIEKIIDKTDYSKIEMPEIFHPTTKERIRDSNTIVLKKINEPKLKETLKAGFRQGKSVREISRDLEPFVKEVEISRTRIGLKDGQFVKKKHKVLLGSAFRSILITRTELARVGNIALLENYKNAGFEKVQWVTVQDGRQDGICDSLNGQTFTANEFANMIPLHVNCRCRSLPVQ